MTITQTPLRHSSYLIQRLDPPIENPGILGANPFSFGGGYKNGGLSDEAMGLIRGIFRFDYMGAAEFEFGAVPEALQKIAKAANDSALDAWEFSVLYSQVEKPWRAEKNPPAPRTRAALYAVGPAENRDAITERVLAFTGKNRPRTKEWVGLNDVLRPGGDYERTTRGWLELDNGYFFFTDRTMWAKTAALFGIEVGDG
jgi:hypothetical protein